MEQNQKTKNGGGKLPFSSKTTLIQMAVGAVIGFAGGFFCMRYVEDIMQESPVFLFYILAWLFVSYPIILVMHEGGHFVMGLLTGYRFLSFRIGSFVLVKTEEGLQRKRFRIAGTGGQCLMTPPEVEKPEKAPFFWYNFGGGLFNLLTAAVCLGFWFLTKSLWLRIPLVILGAFSALLGLGNLIPMKNPIANDGMNILQSARCPYDRGVMWRQFRINALQSGGMRLKDMPPSLFAYKTEDESYLSASMRTLYGAWLLDRQDFAAAETVFAECAVHPKLMELHRNESRCELLFCKIVNGAKPEEIDALYDGPLQTYIQQSGKTFISRKRLMYAYYLIYKQNPAAAEYEYALAQKMKETYPIQGELDGELALMEYIKVQSAS